MTLKELKAGNCANIISVGGSDFLKMHLHNMGLVPNTCVTMIKHAPLGDPIEIEVYSSRVLLRLEDAEKIEVEKIKSHSPKYGGMQAPLISAKKEPLYSEVPKEPLSFVLAGNPNSGKTTLFNNLTGLNQHVGNFPGVTVEKKSAKIKGYNTVTLTDLPGIYSLSPYSIEEKVSRDFLLNEKPACIINIIDANCIERSLFLTLELAKLQIPIVIALNMMDEVRKNGTYIDIDKIQRALGIPICPISASKSQGIENLLSQALLTAKNKTKCNIQSFHKQYSKEYSEKQSFSAHETFDANINFSAIKKLCEHTVIRQQKKKSLSDRIDNILTGKHTAIIVFFCIMALVFHLTFNVAGAFLQDLLEIGIERLAYICDNALESWNVNIMLRNLITDGIFNGVGSVLSFVPVIVILFFFISLLEDSGYMARAAFIADKPLRKIGLSGKSIVPLLTGFGCSVPGIMATRTLSSRHDRIKTILLIPFISCSAKLPIYGFLASVFFPNHSGIVVFSLYFLGIALGVFLAFVSKKLDFSKDSLPFVMEMPPYRMPGLKNVFRLLRDKTKDFVCRAFSVIFISAVIVWFLKSFDMNLNFVQSAKESILAQIAKGTSFIFEPLGFGDWRVSTSLIAGFMAKESVVSTLAVLVENSALLCSVLSPEASVSFLVFCLLYTPCIAAIAAAKRELGAKWAVFMVISQCAIAWVCSFTVKIILNLFF